MRKNLRGRMPRLRFDRMFRAQYIIVRSGEAATRRLWGAGEARVRDKPEWHGLKLYTSICCDPVRLVRIGELAIVFEVGIAKKEGMPRSWCFSRRYQKNEGHPHGQ